MGSLFAELGVRKFKKLTPSFFAPFGYSGTKLGVIGLFQSGVEWVLYSLSESKVSDSDLTELPRV